MFDGRVGAVLRSRCAGRFRVRDRACAGLVLRFTPLEPPFDFGAVDALIGIVYGILLAILVLFASQHYTAAVNDSNGEATALNNMYKSSAVLPLAAGR